MRSVLVTFFIAIAIAATVTAPPIATADDKFDNRCKFNTQTSLLPLPFVAPTPNETAAAPKPRTPSGEVSPKPDDTASKVNAALKRLFAYHSPGVLHPKDNRKGREGDRKVYLPDIIFPIRLGEDLHPHMNSQIYGFGGGGWNGKGAAGGTECAPGNYDHFVQYDNYCEVRGWGMPMCPSGTGHQGVDIRPPSCKDARWEAVAVADGIITRVTRNTTVTLKGTDGTDFYYLHLHPRSIVVKAGQKVKQGDVIGKVSRYMGGKPSTTTHLHFHVRQTVQVNGRTLSTYIPIYTSLINAYRKAKGLGSAVDKNGNLYIDAKYEIGVDPQLDNLPREKTEPEQPKPKDKTGETKEPPKPDEKPEPEDKSKQAKKPDETNAKDQPPKPDTPKPEEKPTQQKPEPSTMDTLLSPGTV